MRIERNPWRALDPSSATSIPRGSAGACYTLSSIEDGLDSTSASQAHLCSTYCRELGPALCIAVDRQGPQRLDTLIRAVTEDRRWRSSPSRRNQPGRQDRFETAPSPLNGVTTNRIMGMTADTPYWLGIHPVVEQRITGLRLIWPDDHDTASGREFSASVYDGIGATVNGAGPMPVTIAGTAARRYAHLAVIDSGKA